MIPKEMSHTLRFGITARFVLAHERHTSATFRIVALW
jgi:hypothetical protein